MDSDVLNAMSPCTREYKGKDKDGKKVWIDRKCQWLDAMIGKCKIKSDIKCPKGVRRPQQEVMETDYRII